MTVLLLATCLAIPQSYGQLHPRTTEPEEKLPSGKSQKEEILKAEYEQSLKDVAELAKLAEDLKSELEKNDRHVLSVNALKQLDTIEKLTKKIRSRLKRF
jgi:hypothetical protein